jgi:hypothetical protein
MQAAADGSAHQLVPGRVEVHLVDPVAEGVVRPQDGRVHIRQPGQLLRGCGARQQAQLVQLSGYPAGALTLDSGQQGLVSRYVMAS